MKKRLMFVGLFITFLLIINPTFAAETKHRVEKAKQPPPAKDVSADKLSVTHHKVKVNGRTIKYTATAGCLQIKDESDKPRAHLFFIAYEREAGDEKAKRPITFAFNGGPGAASVFLHLGAIGPKRVLMDEADIKLPKKTKLVDNDYTWLEFTDLVFIDPVGTGYSRAAQGVDAKQFYGVEEDKKLAAEFIRLYTTRNSRWLSPKFIAGESYGSTRAAALSGYLQNNLNMYLNGLILVSPALNFQTLRFNPGNDLPCVLYLPSYTATAWYHKKLSAELQSNLGQSLEAAEAWAQSEYAAALLKGDKLSAPERTSIVEKLSFYTGIAKSYIENSNLRIIPMRFVKEILRREHRTVGILDSRVKGIDSDSAGEYSEFDPALFLTTGPYAAAMNNYVRNELNYANDLPYEVLNLQINREWNWGSAAQGYINVSGTLREAMSKNTNLNVLIACGYYDLATPYYAAKYTVSHLGLDPALRDNIVITYYDSGHQIYTHLPSLKKMTNDASAFVHKVCQ
jgi:carboxypeptidase C (cathepsin A)